MEEKIKAVPSKGGEVALSDGKDPGTLLPCAKKTPRVMGVADLPNWYTQLDTTVLDVGEELPNWSPTFYH
ncbi:MAG: hypothetical protein WCX69_06045 [Candidatus Paceibacterota bacterium]